MGTQLFTQVEIIYEMFQNNLAPRHHKFANASSFQVLPCLMNFYISKLYKSIIIALMSLFLSLHYYFRLLGNSHLKLGTVS